MNGDELDKILENFDEEPSDESTDKTVGNSEEGSENSTEQTENSSDSAVFIEVDGQKVTAEDIKKLQESGLRESDYTQKAQGVADDRRKLVEEKEEMQEKLDTLRKYEEIEELITSTPQALEKYDELKTILSSNAQNAPRSVVAALPKKYQEQLEALVADKDAREKADGAKRTQEEMVTVRKRLGDLSEQEVKDFESYAMSRMNEIGAEIPYTDLMWTYDPFRKKAISRLREAEKADDKKRSKSKGNAPSSGGKGSSTPAPKSTRQELDNVLDKIGL